MWVILVLISAMRRLRMMMKVESKYSPKSPMARYLEIFCVMRVQPNLPIPPGLSRVQKRMVRVLSRSWNWRWDYEVYWPGPIPPTSCWHSASVTHLLNIMVSLGLTFNWEIFSCYRSSSLWCRCQIQIQSAARGNLNQILSSIPAAKSGVSDREISKFSLNCKSWTENLSWLRSWRPLLLDNVGQGYRIFWKEYFYREVIRSRLATLFLAHSPGSGQWAQTFSL